MIALIIGTPSAATHDFKTRLADRGWHSLLAAGFNDANRLVQKHAGEFSLVVVDPSNLNEKTIEFVAALRKNEPRLTVFLIVHDLQMPVGIRELLPEGTYMLRETHSEYFDRMLECLAMSSSSLLADNDKFVTV